MKKGMAILLCMACIGAGVLAGCGTSKVANKENTQKENNVDTDTKATDKNKVNENETVAEEKKEYALKTGLGVVTSVTGSKDATTEDGAAQADISIAAVTVDEEGRIVTCAIDSVQTNLNFNMEGKITTDLNTEFLTKQELGEAYGLKNASPIGKEWNEQADAFAAYCVGKTVDEINGIAVTEAGTAEDPELAASCTIRIGDFQAVVTKAVENAK